MWKGNGFSPLEIIGVIFAVAYGLLGLFSIVTGIVKLIRL